MGRSIPLVLALGLLVIACTGEARQPAASSSSMYGAWELAELDGAAPAGEALLFIGLTPVSDLDGNAVPSMVIGGPCEGGAGGYRMTGDRLQSTGLASGLRGCGNAELQDQVNQLVEMAHVGVRIDVADWQLTMTGDDGTAARFDRRPVASGEGVYRLVAIDGVPTDGAGSLTIHPRGFSAGADCRTHGDIERQGDRLVFLNPSSSRPAPTTTVPEGEENDNPVPPIFRCEPSDEGVGVLLVALDGGEGIVEADQLVLTSPQGRVLTLRLA